MAAATIRALNRILREDASRFPEDADSPMELEEFVRRSYRTGNRDITEDESHLLVAAATVRARLRHADYDRLRPAMSVVACGLHPFWAAISLDEFLEVLYCAAKHADFMNEPGDTVPGLLLQ
jgi:hypothetical protein